MSDAEPLLHAIAAELPTAIELRHRLHRVPDRSGDEAATRDLVLDWLPDGTTQLAAGTGALRRIGRSGPAVGIRGELDALPVTESSNAEWASNRLGLMHACGHDVHLAAVVALARAAARLDAMPPMVVVLQPREETHPSGALDLVSEGALDSAQIRAMVAGHVHQAVAAGSVACTGGVVNASADEFDITVTGVGGHAAYPQLSSDPVLAAASIVVALQQIVSRNVDPLQSAVVGVGAIHSGDAPNVVPASSVIRGTIRCLSAELRDLIHHRVEEIATSIAAAHRCDAQVSVKVGEPVLHNDVALADATRSLLSACGLRAATPMVSCGADDFAYYSAVVPSLMMFVGVDTPGAGLHHPSFVPPDEAVGDVARALAAGYLAAGSR